MNDLARCLQITGLPRTGLVRGSPNRGVAMNRPNQGHPIDGVAKNQPSQGLLAKECVTPQYEERTTQSNAQQDEEKSPE